MKATIAGVVLEGTPLGIGLFYQFQKTNNNQETVINMLCTLSQFYVNVDHAEILRATVIEA